MLGSLGLLASILYLAVILFVAYLAVLFMQFLKLGIAYYTRELERVHKK